ncbi:DUF6941 family protein [Acidithiobacillus ferridurans]|uniref:DUF6941 family protein n=1 Tax=Acidithiobacillus ferridurans TaxID=1232575 RepID=UPI001C06CDF3|nr:hypothetical protein [Acidithiobacillus ferridurans]MBU2732065.1 hypothetical protein [Acidithiobacillus ferridurans]
MTIDRHVEAIWCDDIRQEIGGKFSLMGVYNDKLIVGKFPASLQKLCLVIRIITTARRPFRSIKITIKKDDGIFADFSLPEEEIKKFTSSAMDNNKENGEALHMLISQAVFTPVKLEGPCIFRIRVETEDDELLGQGLIVSAE